MSSKEEIAKNSMMLYIRMFIVMGITLYTSRIILSALGISNFGIYTVVAGVVSMISFVSNSLSISVQRHLSYSLGCDDFEQANKVFRMSVNIHILLALIVIAVLMPLNYFMIDNFLNIPVGNKASASALYVFVVVTCAIQIIQIPYAGLMIALERMDIFAVVGIIDAVLKLGIAFVIMYMEADSLVLYGRLLMIITAMMLVFYIIMCRRLNRGISYRLMWCRVTFRKLAMFATWSALGELAWTCTLQGVNVVLNLFYGVVCNTAFGIALQINGAVNKFIQSFQTALVPPIIKDYASGDISRSLLLTLNGIKYSYCLVLMVVIPAYASMAYVIRLWLGEVPEYAVTFCRLTLLGILADSLSNLFATTAKANGNIRNYQIIISSILILNLPLSYLVMKIGFPAWSVYVIYVVVSVLLLVTRIFLISEMTGMRLLRPYLSDVIIPVVKISLCSTLLLLPMIMLMEDSWPRLIAVVAASLIVVPVATFGWAMDKSERQAIVARITQKFASK